MKINSKKLRDVLQNLLDFIGTDGVVNEKYDFRCKQLCDALRADIAILEKESLDTAPDPG